MSRYRWALTPRWILSHLFVLACIVAFVNLGLWQLRRLDERKASNEIIATREVAAPVPAVELAPRGASGDATAEAAFRRVTAEGTYRVEDQVLIRERTNEGAPGFWVVTPVVTASGDGLVVNRGWIPLTVGESGDPADYAPPAGTVRIVGLVRESQHPQGLEVADPADGRLARLSRVDVDRLQKQVGVPLLPVYVDLQAQDPAQPATLPQVVPAPELDEGSHLSYAFQWFLFAGLTAVVYPLLLRRHARQLEAGEVAGAGGVLDEVPVP